MVTAVNLDALIPREDLAVQGSGDEAPVQQTIQVRDLEKNSFFFGAIRKPDFQRETSEWTPQRVTEVVKVVHPLNHSAQRLNHLRTVKLHRLTFQACA